jgi:GH24 family phage-related lysozyme (muramidase)
MKLNGVNLLAELEGLELVISSAGVWTIGLGILLLENGRRLKR